MILAANGCAATAPEDDTGASGEDALSENTPNTPKSALECTDADYDVCNCNFQIKFDWYGIWTAEPVSSARKQQLEGQLAPLASCEGGQEVLVYKPSLGSTLVGSDRGWLRLYCNDGPKKGTLLGDMEMFETIKLDTRRVLTATIKRPDGSTETGVFTRPHSTPAARCYP
jgi:hypothetical protein